MKDILGDKMKRKLLIVVLLVICWATCGALLEMNEIIKAPAYWSLYGYILSALCMASILWKTDE